jgi:hypothetical protein
VLGEASASERRPRRARRGEREVAARLARVRLHDAAKCGREEERRRQAPKCRRCVAHPREVRGASQRGAPRIS